MYVFVTMAIYSDDSPISAFSNHGKWEFEFFFLSWRWFQTVIIYLLIYFTSFLVCFNSWPHQLICIQCILLLCMKDLFWSSVFHLIAKVLIMISIFWAIDCGFNPHYFYRFGALSLCKRDTGHLIICWLFWLLLVAHFLFFIR